MDRTATQTLIDTYRQPLDVAFQRPVAATILHRLHQNDATAVAACLRAYGNKIWTFFKRQTRSIQEAELVA